MNSGSKPAGGRGELLVFDLDGTLIDSVGDLTTAINRLRHDYRLAPLPAVIVRHHVGNGARKLVERSLADIPIHLDDAVRRFRGYYERHMHDTTTLYPGVAAGLRHLRAAGYQLAVISNKSGPFCRELLGRLGISDLFGCIAGDGDTVRLKPDPEPLRTVMQVLNAAPAHTWMIGDHHTDLEMARRAGVRSVFVAYGLGQTGAEKPDRRCADFAAVVKLFTA